MFEQHKIHKVSPTLAIHQAMQKRTEQGLPCFKFGFGQSPFPVPQIMVEALKKEAHQKAYMSSQGLLPLREKVASYYNQRYQLGCDGGQVVIGPGSKELLFLTQLIFKRTLVLPAPSWVSYAPQSQYLDLPCKWISCVAEHNYKIQPDTLEETLKEIGKPALIVLNSPNNPTGHVYSKAEVTALAAVADRYDLLIISDEIYSEYTYTGDYFSFAQVCPQRTLLFNGISKARGAGGWRLGWVVFPSSLKAECAQFVSLASETFSCVSTPIQYAALEAFEDESIRDYVQKTGRILACIAEYVNTNLTGKIKAVLSEGGFYTMVKFDSPLTDDITICNNLLKETGVALLAGQHFGNSPDEKTARLAFVDFDGAIAMDDFQINNLTSSLSAPHFDHLKEGILRLNNWANK